MLTWHRSTSGQAFFLPGSPTTLFRWSGRPPANRLGPWRSLSSSFQLGLESPHRSRSAPNVRRKVAALGCSQSPLGGSRRRMPKPFFLGAMAVRQQRACLWLAGQGASLWLVSGALRGWQCLHRCAAGCSPRRWRISPRLRPVLLPRHCMQHRVAGLSRAGARQHAMAGSAPAVAVPRHRQASAAAGQVIRRARQHPGSHQAAATLHSGTAPAWWHWPGSHRPVSHHRRAEVQRLQPANLGMLKTLGRNHHV